MNAYLPLSDADRRAMLAAVGAADMDELLAHVPRALRLKTLDLPPGEGEWEVSRAMRALAGRNAPMGERSFLGAGVYQRFVPAAVDALLSRSEFYTAYTPYQPEISQGTLQATYEYQSMVCALTGMDVANASLYDASTAVPEAAFMALRVTKREGIVLAGGLHPEYAEVLRTYARGPQPAVATAPSGPDGRLDLEALAALVGPGTGAVVVQTPNFLGLVEEIERAAAIAHAAGALLVVVAEPTSLALLKTPGEAGADIVVGDGQSLGNAASFGGPHVGFLACKAAHFRQLPGRIAGATVDSKGEKVYTLTLQTREQHIRREKATSNICTNQALNALAVTIYLSLAGPAGLAKVAEVSAERAHALAGMLGVLPGCSLPYAAGPWLNEFVLETPLPAAEVLRALAAKGVQGGVALSRFFPDRPNQILVAATEVNPPEALDAYAVALAEVLA